MNESFVEQCWGLELKTPAQHQFLDILYRTTHYAPYIDLWMDCSASKVEQKSLPKD
jgi:hypothetical protein